MPPAVQSSVLYRLLVRETIAQHWIYIRKWGQDQDTNSVGNFVPMNNETMNNEQKRLNILNVIHNPGAIMT